MRIEPLLNGTPTPLEVEPQELLLDVLRDRLGLTGAKRSCDVQVCGTCTVLVDGLPISACNYLAIEVDDREVTTIEGLRDSAAYERIEAAFTRHAAVQCGFCTPAMMLVGAALIEQNNSPTEDEVRWAISGNLCRCTGYINIVKSIQAAAAEIQS